MNVVLEGSLQERGSPQEQGSPREGSLRERKKAETRRALHRAAMRLAVERGLDAVTVEAIADAANVSRRTFSNYFANKEEAVLDGERVRTERFLEELRLRPRTEPPWAALSVAAQTVFSDLDAIDPDWMVRVRLVRRHPSLLARQIAAQVALDLELADTIALRSPSTDPLAVRVMASTFQATLRAIVVHWSERPETGSLPQLLARGLDLAGRGFEDIP